MKWGILLRLFLFSASRRPARVGALLSGLLVGSAVLTASLVAGDSVTFGIRKGTLDAFGPADEFLGLSGNLPFPESLGIAFREDPWVQRSVAGVSPIFVGEGSVKNPQTGRVESGVNVVGFHPDWDRPFEEFHTPEGALLDGSELGPEEVYVREDLASKVGLKRGDPLVLYALSPPIPLSVHVKEFQGTVEADVPCELPLPCSPTGAPTFFFDIPSRSRGWVGVLLWDPSKGFDLDLEARSPSGLLWKNTNGSLGSPDSPSILRVDRGEEGKWEITVRSKGAVLQNFRLDVFVFQEEYNLTKARESLEHLPKIPGGAQEGSSMPRSIESRFVVREIVTSEGRGGNFLGEAIFLPLSSAQKAFDSPGKITLIKVTNSGTREGGVGRTEEVTHVLEQARQRLAQTHPDSDAASSLVIRPVKKIFLERAEEAGSLLKEFLTVVSSFTLLSGLLLVVNVLVLLGEERKVEMGIARAVGLTRRDLVTLLLLEGGTYALLSSALGALVGTGLAFVLVAGINHLVSSRPDSLITIPFHLVPESPALAFLASLILMGGTTALVSLRLARFHVPSALRDLPEPTGGSGRVGRTIGALLTAALLPLSWVAFQEGNFLGEVLLVPLLFSSMALLFATGRNASTVARALGAAVALYSLLTFLFLPDPPGLVNRVTIPLRGLLVVLGVVLVLVTTPLSIDLPSRALSKARALVPLLLVARSYPLQKKVRSGLTTSMFALGILVLVVFSVFTATFVVDPNRESGGYDLRATTSVWIPDLVEYARKEGKEELLSNVESIDSLASGRRFGGDVVTVGGQRTFYRGPPLDIFYAITPSFASQAPLPLLERDPSFPTDRDAYESLLKGSTTAIVSFPYSTDEEGNPGAHHVGETLEIRTPEGIERLRIVGIQRQSYFGGIFVPLGVLQKIFANPEGVYLVKLRKGADPKAEVQRLEEGFAPLGLEARAIREEAREFLEEGRRFFTLFELYLGLGLVVGASSLSIVMARATHERRRELGILRSIGFTRRKVLTTLLLEVLLTVTLGVVSGAFVGIIIAWGVTHSSEALDRLGGTFQVPWGELFGLLLLSYVVACLAAFLPALRASRIPPAKAVRPYE